LRKSKKLSLPIKHLKASFHKQERLCSKKQMELLFGKGKSNLFYPVKLIFLKTPVNLQYPAQAMFVVPKRQFKKAHDRNKLKRRMREAYRLNKHSFYEQLELSNKKIILALIYVGKKAEEYALIEKVIVKHLQGLK
jgi:ribonuclease P protein component